MGFIIGQLQDTLPRLLEQAGHCAAPFVFMDQRGTAFHEDLVQLERLILPRPTCHVAADNVTKPGAPVFIWNAVLGTEHPSFVWSLAEFGIDEVEDWQVVVFA